MLLKRSEPFMVLLLLPSCILYTDGCELQRNCTEAVLRMRRHDMFNVRLGFAKVLQNRRYELFRSFDAGGAKEQPTRRGRYVGPALASILNRQQNQLPDLAVLDVPGLPEV